MDDSERLKTNATVVEAFFHFMRGKRKRKAQPGQERLNAAYRERAEVERIERLAEEWEASGSDQPR